MQTVDFKALLVKIQTSLEGSVLKFRQHNTTYVFHRPQDEGMSLDLDGRTLSLNTFTLEDYNEEEKRYMKSMPLKEGHYDLTIKQHSQLLEMLENKYLGL